MDPKIILLLVSILAISQGLECRTGLSNGTNALAEWTDNCAKDLFDVCYSKAKLSDPQMIEYVGCTNFRVQKDKIPTLKRNGCGIWLFGIYCTCSTDNCRHVIKFK